MESRTLDESIGGLVSQYLCNRISLDALVQRSEVLLEQSGDTLPPERRGSAMNCVYVLEEINALTLDEARRLTAAEHARVKSELERLRSFVANV